MSTSLRRGLLLRAGIATAVVFAVLAIVLYGCVRYWLIAELDRGLLAEATALTAAVEFHRGETDRISIDFDGGTPAQFAAGPNAHYFQLWSGKQLAASSVSLGGSNLPLVTSSADQPRFTSETLPQGNARQVSITFVPTLSSDDHPAEATPSGQTPVPLTLLVARNTRELASALAQLRGLLAAACTAAVLACVGLLAATIRRGLIPVDKVAEQIGRVGRANLADRLDPSQIPYELRPIVERLNEMLGRLQSAFEREQAFTADVAHELRTPLAGLETALDVCASRPRQSEEYHQVVGRCLQVTRQMHAMVDSLLTLARADAGTLTVSRQSFCLESLIEDVWAQLIESADQRGLHVSREIRVTKPIRSDREKTHQIVFNLLENAVEYCDDGGKIFVEATAEDHVVWFSVSNTGSQLSQQQAEQATARFWRGDTARSQNGRHCGLGLAIVRELVAAMKGQLQVTSEVKGQFKVRVMLPSETSGNAFAGAESVYDRG